MKVLSVFCRFPRFHQNRATRSGRGRSRPRQPEPRRAVFFEPLEDRRLLNAAPVAVDDQYSMDYLAGSLTVAAPGVLANDLDWNGDPLTAALGDPPLHGSVDLSSNGSFIYTPNVAFRGSDQFTYWANDGSVNSAVPGSVRIHVEPPTLLKDIDLGTVGSDPKYLVEVGGRVFFTADDGIHGRELWASDGTQAGTMLLKDIYTGTLPYDPYDLTKVNGTLFFVATDATHGTELWKSDGTPEGTVLVKDINPGTGFSIADYLTNVNGTLFFNASDGTNGWELWKSDGTEAGTVMVKDINPAGVGSRPMFLTNVNGTLYFCADDGTYGRELWKSDGTEAGTVLVKDIWTGVDSYGNPSGSFPRLFTDVNGTVFFTAETGTYGRELWKSNGTTAGTVLVKDIYSGSTGSGPGYLTNVSGTLFFSAVDVTNGVELWKSDGTAAGTLLVRDILTGNSGSSPANLTSVIGTLYFTADDGTSGRELWKSNGTAAGTVMLKDINPGSEGSMPLATASLANVSGTLYFAADDGGLGPGLPNRELWKTDGTEAGTVMVKDIWAGTSNSDPSWLTNVQGTLFFAADDGTRGRELWKSDGTADGTVIVRDICAIPTSPVSSYLASAGGTLYFTAADVPHGRELWKSDGTTAGTVMVKDIRPGSLDSFVAALTDVSGTLYFASGVSSGRELWKSDGSAAGTVLVKDIWAGGWSSPAYLTNVNGTLYFHANDGTNGVELWKSDGTEAGTLLVKDIRPGTESSWPGRLTNVSGTLYFVADDGTNGIELWKSDGTAAGTVLVKDVWAGGSSSPEHLTNVNGTLYFAADDGTNGTELWKSDGTAAGTVLVKDIWPTSSGSSPMNLTAVGGTLYFSADDGTNGRELWKSDGTAAGTVLVKDIYSGSTGSYPGYFGDLTNVNGTLYFSAWDGSSGWELWKSDGTAEGTVLVKDIYPGAGHSIPDHLTNVNGRLYFGADDGTNGTELWRSDGTAAGTVLVAHLNPGSGTSDPSQLTVVDGNLFLIADDGITGSALWVNQDAEIRGTKFNDLDGDGLKDTGEPGLQGWTIYLDANNNGQLDTGETSTTTATDGTYSFPGLVPGTYVVREVAQSGWVQTAPVEAFWTESIQGNETVADRDFSGIDWAGDNSWSGYQQTGVWSTSAWCLPGRQGPFAPNEVTPNCAFRAGGGDGSNKATWTLSGLPAGAYEVLATYTSAAQRADDATYTVLDGTTFRFDASVDQKWDPNDVFLAGRGWELLGSCQVDGGILNVELSDDANGKVSADAVFARKLPDLPAGVMDNRYPDCTQSGTGWWRSLWSLDGRQGPYRESNLIHLGGGEGSNTATWTFDNLTNGTYDVYTTWTSATGRATNAPYAVYNGAAQGTPELAVSVNQQVEADDVTYDGHGWHHLGSAPVTGGIMTVELADNADGKIVADAMYVKLQGSGQMAAVEPTSSPDGVPGVAYLVAALLYEADDYGSSSDSSPHQDEELKVYSPYWDLPETDPGAVDAIDLHAETFDPWDETAPEDLAPSTPGLTESASDEGDPEILGQFEAEPIFADDWLLESTWADL